MDTWQTSSPSACANKDDYSDSTIPTLKSAAKLQQRYALYLRSDGTRSRRAIFQRTEPSGNSRKSTNNCHREQQIWLRISVWGRQIFSEVCNSRATDSLTTGKDLQLLINHEKDFFTGTPLEQDSIKDLIRYWEHKGGYDKTLLYFAPIEN